jgi:starvation-inducible DNA-binding protein
VLSDLLKTLLATNFAYYLKAHGFHWNVEGPDFGELHTFFEMIYSDVYEANDTIAEYIRALQEYAPASFERFGELTQIPGQTKIPRAKLMLEELLNDNEIMLQLLNECFDVATQERQQGIANFMADRISQHGKFGWQLRSFLKEARA